MPGRHGRTGLHQGIGIELQALRGLVRVIRAVKSHGPRRIAAALGPGRSGRLGRGRGDHGFGRGRLIGGLTHGRHGRGSPAAAPADLGSHGQPQFPGHKGHGQDHQGNHGQDKKCDGQAAKGRIAGQPAHVAGRTQKPQAGQHEHPDCGRGVGFMPGQEQEKPQGRAGEPAAQGKGGHGQHEHQEQIKKRPARQQPARHRVRPRGIGQGPARRQVQRGRDALELPVETAGRQGRVHGRIARAGRQIEMRLAQLHPGRAVLAQAHHGLVLAGNRHPPQLSGRQQGQRPAPTVLAGHGVAHGQALAGKIEPHLAVKGQRVAAGGRAAPKLGQGKDAAGLGGKGRIGLPGAGHIGGLGVDAGQAFGPDLPDLAGLVTPDLPAIGAHGRPDPVHLGRIAGDDLDVVAPRAGVEDKPAVRAKGRRDRRAHGQGHGSSRHGSGQGHGPGQTRDFQAKKGGDGDGHTISHQPKHTHRLAVGRGLGRFRRPQAQFAGRRNGHR